MQWENRNSGGESNEGNLFADEKSAEATKIVRCVIDNDVDEGWRRLGGGDHANAAPSRRESNHRLVCSTAVDTLRMKNHLEWKKQKEMEYSRKKEADKLEEEKRKQEKLKQEKEARRKEKEREEKMREWQEQKAREKEERKREEMVLKALEREIKGVSQTLDKEKLIHEWIRLKNKQKQLESEKKAEIMKKEEETRALRQALAEISYRQWKERTKSRRITLPKNGYQIFGPKPAPVVKEAWNHDFTNGGNEERGLTARSAKSTVSVTSARGAPALARPARSRTSVNDSEAFVSLRELNIPEIGSDNKSMKGNDPQKTIWHGFTSKLQNTSALPSKNKLDVYLEMPQRERMTKKSNDLNNYLRSLGDVNSELLIDLNEKFSNGIEPGSVKGIARKSQLETLTRRSKSFHKPRGKAWGNRSCSASSDKLEKSGAKTSG